MKIYTCTCPFWPGVKTYLKSIHELIKNEIPGANITDFDINPNGLSYSVLNKIRNEPPDYLFIGGWDQNIRTIIQNTNKKRTTVVSAWCSPLSQVDLGNEIVQFVDLINFIKNGYVDYVTCLLYNDYKVLNNLNNSFLYCPVYMDFKEMDSIIVEKEKHDMLYCDLFCAPNSRKNVFAQIMILSYFKNIKLFTNYGVSKYSEAAKMFLENKYDYGWMDRNVYLKSIQNMDFSMQCSFSEGFNYTAAEHMYYGIPTLISKTFPYKYKVGDTKILEKFIVEDPSNSKEIHDKVSNIINDKNLRDLIGDFSKESIIITNNENKESVLEFLNTILKRKFK